MESKSTSMFLESHDHSASLKNSESLPSIQGNTSPQSPSARLSARGLTPGQSLQGAGAAAAASRARAEASRSKLTGWVEAVPGVRRTRLFTRHWFLRVKWIIVQVFTAILVLAVLIWASVFLYGTFHYNYMPAATSHERPVNLKFRTDCETGEGLCSFPSSNLSLITSNNVEILVRGQPYIVLLELEMPESYVNQKLGMFMVQVQFLTVHGAAVTTISRAAMMKFKSLVFRVIETLWYLPSLLVGSSAQKQTVVVEMASDYQVDPFRPTIGVVVEVQSRRIEIYSTMLRIHARFYGLRYLIFYWPTVSAIVGIGSNFFFLSVAAVFSWLAIVGRLNQALSVASRVDSDRMDDSAEPVPALVSEYEVKAVSAATAEKQATPGSSKKRVVDYFYNASSGGHAVDLLENISATALPSSDDEDYAAMDDSSDAGLTVRRRRLNFKE